MKKEILPRHFTRVAASNELSSAEKAIPFSEALMISQPFALKTRNSIGPIIDSYRKPFLIDPETYKYFFIKKRHYKQKKLRAWLKEMSQLMPEEIKESFGNRKASFTNFDAFQIIEFCKANISIQTSLKTSTGDTLLPLAIMCPYALIEENDFSAALQFHFQLVNTMVKINETDLPVIACLYLSRDLLLRTSRLDRIVDAVNTTSCEGVAIWIEGFDEATLKKRK